VIPPLADRFGLGDRELVAIVGAGGKSTILFLLGAELSGRGAKVVVTTTTMMAEDQVTRPTCTSAAPAAVREALTPGVPLMVVTGTVPGKVTGPDADDVDRLFSGTDADYVLVEADGARSNAIKAPGPHEPVIPSRSTTVIVVMSAAAIGRTLRTVAHRPDRVAALAGIAPDDPLSVDAAARVLLSPMGGHKSVPGSANLRFALTRVTAGREDPASDLASLLGRHPDVGGVVLIPEV
jgi:probable selenium-dependent hydroxylase accessory protein YqeC